MLTLGPGLNRVKSLQMSKTKCGCLLVTKYLDWNMGLANRFDRLMGGGGNHKPIWETAMCNLRYGTFQFVLFAI
jgi:hypothetical protein